MSKSGKGLNREMRRKLKRQRKQYIRAEKESVKKQKQELKEKARKRRQRLINEKGGWLRYLAELLFGTDPQKTTTSHDKLRERGFTGSTKENFQDAKRRQGQQKEQKIRNESTVSDQIKREKQNLKEEKMKLRAHQRAVNKRIRRERLNYLKENFKRFLRNPLNRKKLNREQRLLQKQIKEDIKKERREFITGMPSRISGNISRSVKIRKSRYQYSLMLFRKSMGKFGGFMELTTLRNDILRTLLNSIVLYIIAFYAMYLLNRLATIVTAGFFDIPAVLYSYRIFWPLYTYSSLYTRMALVVIFALGPIISLAAGIGMWRLFMWLKKFNLNLKILVVWMIFHAFNLFFGAYIAGVITRTGFVYTTEWLFYSNVFDVEEIIFLIVSVVALLIAGYYLSRQFLVSAITPASINKEYRLYYVLAQVLLPWIIGNSLLILINFPNNPPELLVLYAVSVLMVIPVMSVYNAPSIQQIKIPGARNKVRMGWIYFVIAALLVYFIREVLHQGISFS